MVAQAFFMSQYGGRHLYSISSFPGASVFFEFGTLFEFDGIPIDLLFFSAY